MFEERGRDASLKEEEKAIAEGGKQTGVREESFEQDPADGEDNRNPRRRVTKKAQLDLYRLKRNIFYIRREITHTHNTL